MQNINDQVLFEITEAHLDTGLRGVPVGFCSTSSVDPIRGLCYRGKEVSSLARWSPERVMYLIFYGKEGS